MRNLKNIWKYAVVAIFMDDDAKNVHTDLTINDWGNGSPEEFLFDTKEEAEQLMEAFIEDNQYSYDCGMFEIGIEAIEEE